MALLYSIEKICKRKQFTYNICESYNQLVEKFNEISALILFELAELKMKMTKDLRY